MMVCPVCEHSQPQGAACDVCGKQLKAPGPVEVPTSPLEGLEGTRLPPAPAAAGGPPILDLEVTRLASGPDAALEDVPGLERAPAPAGAVGVEPVPELDTGRYVDGDPRVTPASDGAVTCRYCKSVQAAGRVCDTCGMRLPRSAPQAPGALLDAGGEETRCQACGAKGFSGRRCSDCGVEVKAP